MKRSPWSAVVVLAVALGANPAAVTGAQAAPLTAATYSVAVTFEDSAGAPLASRPVRLFTGTVQKAVGSTNASVQATLRLTAGSNRFRGDIGRSQFFSAATDACTVTAAACTTGERITAARVTVIFEDSAGTALANKPVRAFAGARQKAMGTTDTSCQARGDACPGLDAGSTAAPAQAT